MPDVWGVNVPSVDMVSFTHQKKVKWIVQAIGRLRNKTKEKIWICLCSNICRKK